MNEDLTSALFYIWLEGPVNELPFSDELNASLVKRGYVHKLESNGFSNSKTVIYFLSSAGRSKAVHNQ